MHFCRTPFDERTADAIGTPSRKLLSHDTGALGRSRHRTDMHNFLIRNFTAIAENFGVAVAIMLYPVY